MDESWQTIPSLVASMPAWMSRLGLRTGGDGPATAAFLTGWVARAAVGLPVILMATQGRALVAEAEGVFLRIADGGWVTGIAPTRASLWVDAGDELVAEPGTRVLVSETGRRFAAGRTAAAWMAPIIDVLRESSGLSARALWWLVADAVAAVAASTSEDVASGTRLVGEICDAMPLIGRRRPTLHHDAAHGSGLRVQRISCCFAYRITGGARCDDCPLFSGRTERRAPATSTA